MADKKARTTDIEINGNRIVLTNQTDNLVIYMTTKNAYYYNVSARFITVDHPHFHKKNMLFMNATLEKGGQHTYLKNLYNYESRLCLYDGHIPQYANDTINILMGFFSSKAYHNSLLYKTNHMINLGRMRARQAAGCRNKARQMCAALNADNHTIHDTNVVSHNYKFQSQSKNETTKTKQPTSNSAKTKK